MKLIFERDASEADKKSFASYLAMEKHLQKELDTDERLSGEHAHAWFVKDLSAFHNVEDLCGMMQGLSNWSDWISGVNHHDVSAHIFDAGKDNFCVFFSRYGQDCHHAINTCLINMVRKTYCMR